MRANYDDIKALNTCVVVASFGPELWARQWLAETQSPFLFVLDPSRAVYRAYGLESSLWRSWGPRTILRYAYLMFLQGRRWRGIRGDTGQLGGDFIVDRQGIVRLAHPSRDPTDRPPVDQLLPALERLA